jgi:hypothetical protein
MKRAAIERTRTIRTWRTHLLTHEQPVRCVCDLQPGRFRKGQRARGCGRAACWLCHGDKLAGRPTLKQRLGRAVEREGMAELLGPSTAKRRSQRIREPTVGVTDRESTMQIAGSCHCRSISFYLVWPANFDGERTDDRLARRKHNRMADVRLLPERRT